MTPTQGEHAQTEALRPKFGDLLRNTMASEGNPRRDAYFIREVHRSGGGVNPGRWFEMTDGKGETWLSNPQNMVPAATPGEHAQTALAHELFAAAQLAPGEGIEDAVRRIAAALTAATAQPAAPQGGAYAELPEPDSYLFQHDETGLTQFVDAQQVEWGFQQNNPRLHRIGGAYTADKMRDFADRTHALRASHGQAPAGAAGESRWNQSPCKHCGETEGEHFNARCRHIQGETRYAPTAQPAPSPTPQADSQPALDRTRIREIFMAHGFTVKEGQTDLKPYVYAAAEALLALAAAPTPAAQADSQPAPNAEFHQFTTGDEGLDELLNETFNLARGPKHNNMDTAMVWQAALEEVLTRLALTPADSVLEDAAQVEIDLFNDLNRTCGNTLTAYAKELCRLGYRKTDAARKQGGKHD